MAQCRTRNCLAASLLLLAGCASAPPPQGPDPATVRKLFASAADQVQRCYRRPRVASEAKQIVTRLRARYSADGQLAGVPEVVWQRSVDPSAERFAHVIAEAASLAVIRCTPLRLPPEAHAGGWEEIEYTFSPVALG
jgi:hypothetical protein